MMITKQQCTHRKRNETGSGRRKESTSEITIQTTNRNSIITICNYETYQVEKNGANQQTNQPARRQSTSNQPTIKQELEEVKNIYRKLTQHYSQFK